MVKIEKKRFTEKGFVQFQMDVRNTICNLPLSPVDRCYFLGRADALQALQIYKVEERGTLNQMEVCHYEFFVDQHEPFWADLLAEAEFVAKCHPHLDSLLVRISAWFHPNK